MPYVKEFFSFTKSKMITLFLLVIILYLFLMKDEAVLGNFELDFFLYVVLQIYLLLNIFGFAFKGKKHFFVAILLFVLLICGNWALADYLANKRTAAMEECVKKSDLGGWGIEALRCMQDKGYKYYR